MSNWAARVSIITVVVLLAAGCFGRGGSNGKDEDAYQGEYKEFELYLFPLLNTSSGDHRWELYPETRVEAWGFSFENDPSTATIPGPEIRVREGDTVAITFIIQSVPMPHTIHWHGIHVPWDQDGVPYLSQAPLGDDQFGGNGMNTYTYEFTVTGQSGTYWYHCHVDTQHHLDMGMYGALIVEPADPAADPAFDQEETLFFDEWDKSHIHSNFAPDQIVPRSGQPEEAIDNLYGQLRDYYQMSTLTTAEAVYDRVKNDPNVPQPVKDFLASNKPSVARENRTWYPVTYPAYYADYDTFLINGKAFPSTEPILVENGKTLRLRLINAGSLVHSIHLHGHHFQVMHKDGYRLPNPYYADTILIGPGERYDIYVVLNNPGPWMLHDHMPQFEQNDNINPGGMMTHICYRDGWALASVCAEHQHPTGPSLTSGEVFEKTTEFFRVTQNAGVAPEYSGGHDH